MANKINHKIGDGWERRGNAYVMRCSKYIYSVEPDGAGRSNVWWVYMRRVTGGVKIRRNGYGTAALARGSAKALAGMYD